MARPAEALTPPLGILAGGTNSRLRSLRGSVYKAFLPIEGASLVARHALRASMFGVRDISVLVDDDDALVGSVVRTLADELAPEGCTIRHTVCPGSIEEKIGAFAEQPPVTSRHLVVLGDTVAGIDLGALVEASYEAGTDSSLGIARFRLPFGVASLDPEGRRVIGFEEKPRLDLMVNTGYMCLGPTAVSLLREHDIGAVLRTVARRGHLAAVASSTEIASFDSLPDLVRGGLGRVDRC
jgi:NDP-sugar pyrophosphorylase family protein